MPVEAPNTLRSRARYKIVDIISEGPIKGLVNGAKSIYLDDTPVQNEDGTFNFPNFSPSRDITSLPAQRIVGFTLNRNANFPASENTVNVGVKITKDNPEGAGSGDGSATRTISDANLDAVRVTVRVPALAVTNLTTGDINGGAIRFQIYVKPNGGSFTPVSSGSQWKQLSTPASETGDGATGIELSVSLSGTLAAAKTVQWQYAKKTGGSFGDWVTYSTLNIPAQSSSSQQRGYYDNWGTLGSYTRTITGLPPGIYKAQAIIAGGSATPIIAREFSGDFIEITGKTVSPYDASYMVNLPDGGAPWDIKVARISNDNTESNYQDDLFWLSYTEIIDNRFSWPNIAGQQISFDAETFGGNVPNRAYDVMGLMIEIPSNYDPYNRTYSGVWNGTFKTDWTDNPAWIFYALLTNKRWGLGNNIPAAQVDKWGLYTIAQYCDELVDAPNGFQEPRYTCSCVINSQQEAYELLTAIASAFRGMMYWSNGAITATADMPTDTLINVGPANVIDGEFTYQGASRKSRHSVARVSWNNPDDGYKLNVEIYEDDEAIRKYGYRPIDINAIGCTSRGLARRWGKWQVASDNNVPDTVTYKASFDHFMTQGKAVRPGDVVAIADPNYSAEQNFGRIVSIVDNENATHTITLDRAITRIGGDDSELQLTLTDGNTLDLDVSTVSNTTGASITIASALLTSMPKSGATWLLKKETVEPRLWRVFSVTEPEPHIYQVSAMLYDPNKYDSIETGLNFEEANFSAMPTGEMPAPTGVLHSEFLKQTGSAIITCVNLSWTRPNDARADLFEVQYQIDGQDWQATTPNLTSQTSIDILNIVPAIYNFRVRAQDTTGLFRSAWTTYASKNLLGKQKPPEDVTGFTATIQKFGILLQWNPVSDIDINYYEIRKGGTNWDNAAFVDRINGTSYLYEDQEAGEFIFRIKARDTSNNYSLNAEAATATGETQNVPVLTAISIPIGIQVDIEGELKRGFSHWQLRRREFGETATTVINSRVTSRIYFDEAYEQLEFGKAYEYSARAVDVNGVASDWSAFTSPVFPLQIQSNDITANQIVGKDFRTALNVGATVDGVRFTSDGIEMWEDGERKVWIPNTGNPEFLGAITALEGFIGGWQILASKLQASNIVLDSEGRIQTVDFVSNNRGWQIDKFGHAEFNDIRARGGIRSAVFQYDEVVVSGGQNLVRPGTNLIREDFISILSAQWQALNDVMEKSYPEPDFSTLTFAQYLALTEDNFDALDAVLGGTGNVFDEKTIDRYFIVDESNQFAVGDIIRIKDGIRDFWGKVISTDAISEEKAITVVYQHGDTYGAEAGQAIVNYGVDGDGGIMLDGQAPLMDIYTHDGEPWNGLDLQVRLGNLKGWGDITTDVYGFVVGQPDGEYMVYDSTSGRLRLNGAIQITEGTGIGNFSDAGALVTADDLDDVTDGATYKKTTANEKTGAGRAYSGLDSNNRLVTAVIPATAVSPSGAGLFLGSNYLGFYNSGWKTYMDNAGNFALIGSGTHGLSWNASTGVLTIAGSMTILGGSGYANLTDKPTALSGINSTEGSKLAGIATGADVTKTTIDGGLVTTGTLQVGSTGFVKAGITGDSTSETAVRIWAGETYANRATAPFRVLQSGALYATNATISGVLTAGSGSAIAGFTATATDLTAGSSTTAIGISTDTDKRAFWAGGTTSTTAPFNITHAGAVTAISGSIGGFTLASDKIGIFSPLSLGDGCGMKTDEGFAHYSTASRVVSGVFCKKSEIKQFYDNIDGHTASISISADRNSGTSDSQAVVIVSVSSTSKYAISTNGIIRGVIENTSDERIKSNITEVSTLETLKSLPVLQWEYDDEKISRVDHEKKVEQSIKELNAIPLNNNLAAEKDIEAYKHRKKHIGPMADAFNKAFNVNSGNNESYVVGDAIGVALRAIQELAEIVDEQKAEIAELRAALNLPNKSKKARLEQKKLTDEEKEMLFIVEKRAKKSILEKLLEAENRVIMQESKGGNNGN